MSRRVESLSPNRLAFLRRQPLTYSEVGRSLTGMPGGYRHLDRSRTIGTGRAAFELAADRLFGWGMQLGAGLRVRAESPIVRADTVVEVGIGLGPVRIWSPCRVLTVVDEPNRRGFFYGTLPGHAEIGEEAFLVEMDGDGQVRYRVRAFSRPGPRWAQLLGPVGVFVQERTAEGYLRSFG